MEARTKSCSVARTGENSKFSNVATAFVEAECFNRCLLIAKELLY